MHSQSCLERISNCMTWTRSSFDLVPLSQYESVKAHPTHLSARPVERNEPTSAPVSSQGPVQFHRPLFRRVDSFGPLQAASCDRLRFWLEEASLGHHLIWKFDWNNRSRCFSRASSHSSLQVRLSASETNLNCAIQPSADLVCIPAVPWDNVSRPRKSPPSTSCVL